MRAPTLVVELTSAQLAHHAGHIGTLTSPAGGRLHVLVAVDAWIAGTQNLAHVVEGVLVATGCVIVARESIASPENNHLGTLLQHVDFLRAVVLADKRGVLGH